MKNIDFILIPRILFMNGMELGVWNIRTNFGKFWVIIKKSKNWKKIYISIEMSTSVFFSMNRLNELLASFPTSINVIIPINFMQLWRAVFAISVFVNHLNENEPYNWRFNRYKIWFWARYISIPLKWICNKKEWLIPCLEIED